MKLAYFHRGLYFIILSLFLLSSCGGGSVSVSQVESQEFVAWKVTVPRNAEDILKWWKIESKAWTFSYYTGLPANLQPQLVVYPDDSTPEQVWRSKIINCNRFCILFRSILGGKVREYSQAGLAPYNHVTLLLDTGEELSLSGLTLSILKKESEEN